jgi:hypothetical protein
MSIVLSEELESESSLSRSIYGRNRVVSVFFAFALLFASESEQKAPDKYHRSTNTQLCIPSTTKPPHTKTQAQSFPGGQYKAR